MRYVGKVFRPPSEANSYILQATLGCSWNHCTYCDMYRDKEFTVRDLNETLADLHFAGESHGGQIDKIFVADGDALIMDMEHWRAILTHAKRVFPRLRRVSAYAMARNLNEKSADELAELQSLGLTQLYIGPESGDDVTLKRIAKGDTFAGHVTAANKAHAAGMKLSVIALLGIGSERAAEHAKATGELITAMNPRFFSALTVTVVPGTPLAKLEAQGKFAVPEVPDLLRELRAMVEHAAPQDTIFRTNHASNYLPLEGRLPRDRDRIIEVIDQALDGRIPLRPEWSRGL